MLRGLILALAVVTAMGQTRAPEAQLAQARRLYNDQRYAEAIKLAEEARQIPALAGPASIVFARAHLEQYRAGSEDASLQLAREALKGLDVAALAPRDQVEFTIALAQVLYIDDQFSAAAEQFEVGLGGADLLDADSRDRLFDWWALSLDRQAQLGHEDERRPSYQRIVDRAERELARDVNAASASYWLAAGARGVNDLPRAWGAAVAAWVRAASLGQRGTALREDLDRLVSQVILPERAVQMAAGDDPKPTLALLESQWKEIKEQWK
jgi:tetratricopeptide (TPR) repeat protein